MNVNEKIRVLIADDNYEFGNTLKNYLNSDSELEVVGVADDGEDAYDQIIATKPDV